MEKEIIVISLDFIFGPIGKDYKNEKGEEITGIKVIDEDAIAQSLDHEINKLWCSLWSKDDTSDDGVKFDEEGEKKLAPQLLDLITKLINRLNEINDGSFEIEDMITDYLKKLIKQS